MYLSKRCYIDVAMETSDSYSTPTEKSVHTSANEMTDDLDDDWLEVIHITEKQSSDQWF